MLVDSHCHLDRLDLTQHDGSLDAALEAARGRGVGHFLCIGVSADNAGAVKALADRYADVDCSVGIHPLDVKPGEMPPLDWLLKELDHPRVVPLVKPVWTTTTSPKPLSCSRRLFACTLKRPA